MPPVKAEVRPDTAFTSVVLDCLEGTTPLGSLRRQHCLAPLPRRALTALPAELVRWGLTAG